MKSIVRQIYIKVLAILLVSTFLTPIIGHTVYAYETTSNSTIEFGSVRKEMTVGERQSLSNLLVFDNKVIGKTNKKVQYKSNNPTVIRVENDEIVSESKGIATITALYENKECSVTIRVYDAEDFANTKEKALKVSLKWKREQSEISLSWTESDALVGFRILRKEINQSEYTEIVKDGVGNTFLDEDVLPDHEYLYKIFLKDKKDKEFALNELNIPIYHPIKKEIKEPIIENKIDIKALEEFIKANYKLKTVPDILIENKPNIIFEIDKEELEKLIREKLVKEFNLEATDSPVSEDKHIPGLDNTEISKEEVIVKEIPNEIIANEKVSDKEASPKDQQLPKDVPGSWEAIKVKKEEILDGSQKRLKLSYYYGEQLNITENNLVIYSIDANGSMSEVHGVTVDTKNKVASFITDKESNYCFEIKVDEQKEAIVNEKSPEEEQPSKEVKEEFKEEVLQKDISVDEKKEDVIEENSTLVERKEDKVETIIAEPKKAIESKKEETKVLEEKVDTPKAKVKEVQLQEDKKETSESKDKKTTIETKHLNSSKEAVVSEPKVSKDVKEEITTDNKLPNKNDKPTKKEIVEVKEKKTESLKENSNKNLEKEESPKIEPNKKEDIAPSVDNKEVDKTEKVKNEKDSKVKEITPITSTSDKPLNIKKEEPKEEVKEVVTKTEVEATEAPIAKKRRKRSLNIDGFAKDARMATRADVYNGPGSSNYAYVGRVNNGEEIRAIGSEWGWIYITYKVDSTNTYKRGYVVKNQLQDANNIYDNYLKEMWFFGHADAVRNNTKVYLGPNSSKFEEAGTVFAGEGVTVFDRSENGYSYIEFSTPSKAKRGYIPSSALQGKRQGTLAVVLSTTPVFHAPCDGAASSGSIYVHEPVVILKQNSSWYFVEYNTDKGRKRGYCRKQTFDIRGSLNAGSIDERKELWKAKSKLTVYTGPNKNYAIAGSIGNKEKVGLLSGYESNYHHIEYATSKGSKRGYVQAGTLQKATQFSTTINTNSKVEKISYGKSGRGRDLCYYKIGNGSKALVAVFAIHGFEDKWFADGEELFKIANRTIQDLSNMGNLNDWTAYIIPTANPDGLLEGATNNGPGRCTVADKIDLNRSFAEKNSNYYKQFSDSRNFNGSRPYQAKEASALKNLLDKTKATHNSMVLLDVHGWENTTIGNGKIGAYFGEQFGFGHKPSYGTGYLIGYGNSIGAESTLVELPVPQDEDDVINRGFAQKVSRAIQNIIKRHAGTSTKAVDTTKVTPVDAKQGKVINVTSHLNIRSGAGQNFDIVGTLKPNQVVDLYGQIDNWYKIYLGYVSKDYIEKLKDTPIKKEETSSNKIRKGQVVNVTSHLNIRSGAGTNFDVVAELQPNQIVDIYDETGEWYKLYLGYANKNYIKKLEDTIPQKGTPVNKKGKLKNVTSHLNIREKAGDNYNIVGKLSPNEIVNLYEKLNGWYKIDQGYVDGKYIKEIDNAIPLTITSIGKKGRVKINVAYVRSKPSFKADKIGELKLNEIVNVIEKIQEWGICYKVDNGSIKGYVLGDHIQVLDDFKNNWKTNGNKKYYIRDGKAVTGWTLIEGSYYYFEADGSMATGEKIIDGKLCKFKPTGEFFKEKVKNEEPRVTKEEVIDYFKDSLEQVLCGRYSDKVTALGTTADIGLAITGLDLPQNLRDISYDVQHLNEGWSNWGNLALDVVSVIPVVGVIKYGKEVKLLFKTQKGEYIAAKSISKAGKTIEASQLINITNKLKTSVESLNDLIKKVYSRTNGILEVEAAGFGKVSIDEKLILEDADDICKNRYASWIKGKLAENASEAEIKKVAESNIENVDVKRIAIPGDADFNGPIKSGSWKLTPKGQGAHLIERINVKGRTELKFFDKANTPRYYPYGTPENAGQAHIRLHEATKKAGIKLRGGNPEMTDIELINLYKQAYSNPSLNGILGELRTPNDTIKLGEYLTPLQAFNKLIKWSE